MLIALNILMGLAFVITYAFVYRKINAYGISKATQYFMGFVAIVVLSALAIAWVGRTGHGYMNAKAWLFAAFVFSTMFYFACRPKGPDKKPEA